LVILGLVIIVCTLLVLLIAIGYISYSGICGFLKELNRGNPNILDELNE